MYGDCQVMCSSMGPAGSLNMVCSSPPETFFPSSPIQNPNFNSFLPASHLAFPAFPVTIIPKEELAGGGGGESGSGSEQLELGGGVLSGTEQEQFDVEPDHTNPNNKKRRYHRHTSRQIQEMETMFKECPHPDDKQRMKLSQELGLKPRQVKFWFQNRRTQMKAQQDRADNAMLRAENETLKHENYQLQAALRNVACPNCGGPAVLGDISFDEQQLRLENARLKVELERVCSLATRYTGRSLQALNPPPPLVTHPSMELDIYTRSFPEPLPENCAELIPLPPWMPPPPECTRFISGDHGGGLLLIDEEKPLALRLGDASMNEVLEMCKAGEPLWVEAVDSGGGEVLCAEAYAEKYLWRTNPNPELSGDGMRTEATRGSAVVIMNSITLVDAFMDSGKWIELFPSIVSRARTLQVVNSGSVSASGSLHLMYAELQVPSPLVPTREMYFLRYCRQNEEDGTWVIIDFPVGIFRDGLRPSLPRCRRRPSGCIIQDRANGYSEVTWLEHSEVEEKPVHQIFHRFVGSGMAYGAKRWLSVLQRQCERLASLMATNVADLGVIPSLEARKNLMRLAQRMVRTFCIDVSTCNSQSWTAVSGAADETVRITTRKVTDPGQTYGIVLTAVSTTWLPYQHHQVFDFLRDERRRSQLDALSSGNSLHEVSHIANGSHPGNCVSLLRINVASNSSQNVELVLQESCTDDSGSLIVFSTMGVDAVQLAMSCEDTSCIPILPLGFSVLPSGILPGSGGSPCFGSVSSAVPGCLLTVGLQALAGHVPTAKISLLAVTAISNQLCNTVQQISNALGGGGSFPSNGRADHP